MSFVHDPAQTDSERNAVTSSHCNAFHDWPIFMTRTDVVSFSRLRVLIGLIAALAVASTALAQTPTVTWTGTTSGSQNMAATPTLAFTTAGTYTLTTNVAITLTFKGAAGGGGGASGYSALTPTNGGSACSGFGCMFGGGGGGGGAVTTGTSVQLVPGKSYTLVVGAGGSGGLAAFNNNGFTANAGTAGGNTTLTRARMRSLAGPVAMAAIRRRTRHARLAVSARARRTAPPVGAAADRATTMAARSPMAATGATASMRAVWVRTSPNRAPTMVDSPVGAASRTATPAVVGAAAAGRRLRR